MYFVLIRYAKLDDIDSWLFVNEKTADIRLTKWPDRESKFLVNGTYYTKIICITNGEFHRSVLLGDYLVRSKLFTFSTVL